MNIFAQNKRRLPKIYSLKLGAWLLSLYALAGSLNGQSLQTSKREVAGQRIVQAESVSLRDGHSPRFVTYKEHTIPVAQFRTDMNQHLGLPEGSEFRLSRSEQSTIPGMVSHRFQQYYNGVEIEGADIVAHEQDGYMSYINGLMFQTNFSNTGRIVLSESAAIARAKQAVVGSEKEKSPQVTLLLHSRGFTYKPESYRLAYKVDLPASS
jgi:Zn-dependent metalloprotease